MDRAMYDYAWMGDVTGDKRADIVMIKKSSSATSTQKVDAQITSYKDGASQLITVQKTLDGSFWDSPAICLPNVNDDSFVLEFIGHELLFTDPIIEAVIASPPYWEGKHNGNGGTTYGLSSGSGSSSDHSGGFAVGFSMGFEFDSGIFGNCGHEFKVSTEHSFNWGCSKATEFTETWGYSTGVGEDKVVFTAVPYDVYYYKVITAPRESVGDTDKTVPKIGGTMTISIPRKPNTYNQELNYYNAHNGDSWDVVLPHTLGNPLSYAKQSDVAKIKDGEKGLFTSDTKMTVGQSDTGTTKKSAEQVTSTEKSFGYGLEVGIEGQIKAAGVTVGASSKFNYGYDFTNSTSTGLFIEGEVPDIPLQYPSDLSFTWGLLMYPMSGPGQNFNLVTYWVE